MKRLLDVLIVLTGVVTCLVAVAFCCVARFSVGKEVSVSLSDMDSDLGSSLTNEMQKLNILCAEGDLCVFQTSDSNLYLCQQRRDGVGTIALERNKNGSATNTYSVLDFTSRMTATFSHPKGTNVCSFVRIGCSGDLISFLDRRGDGRFVVLRREGEDLVEAFHRAIERGKKLDVWKTNGRKTETSKTILKQKGKE